MNIRLLKKEDLEEVGDIIERNYSKTDRKQALREISDMFKRTATPPKYYVAKENGKTVGFSGFGPSMIDYDVHNIFWLAVHPSWQRKGVGKALVDRMIQEAKKKKSKLILLSAEKQLSYSYYKKFGFKNIESYNHGNSKVMALQLI